MEYWYNQNINSMNLNENSLNFQLNDFDLDNNFHQNSEPFEHLFSDFNQNSSLYENDFENITPSSYQQQNDFSQSENKQSEESTLESINQTKIEKIAKNPRNTCSICFKTYSNYGGLINHVKKNHPEKQTRECALVVCGRRGRKPNSKNKTKGVKKQYIYKKQTCRFCNKQYANKGALINHGKVQHPLEKTNNLAVEKSQIGRPRNINN